MRVNKGVRQDMLQTSLWPIITAGFTDSPLTGKVRFFDSGGFELALLEFDDMEIVSTGTSDAIMRLKSIDGSFTLKSTASVEGVVSTFKIRGDDPEEGLGYVINGSVGTLTSSAELRFNITSWIVGTYISIENFEITVPNGA